VDMMVSQWVWKGSACKWVEDRAWTTRETCAARRRFTGKPVLFGLNPKVDETGSNDEMHDQAKRHDLSGGSWAPHLQYPAE
jgi:hypothetical protein